MATGFMLSNHNNSSAPRDLIFENLTFKMISAKDELIQRLVTRLLVFLGEWWLNVNLGIDYMNDILIKAPYYETIASDFKRVILQTDGISKILSFSINDINNQRRAINISFDCQSDDGEILEVESLNLQVT